MHRLDSVDSTLDEVHRLAERGAPEGTAVVAAEQTAGRGSRGRTWHSPRGGLWLSLLLRPVEAATDVLSLRVGLVVAEVIEELAVAERIGLKWPNDVMLHDRKLGGILCEGRWQGGRLGWVAVGIGLNIANPVPPSVAASAIRLADVAPVITPDLVAAPLVARLCSTPLAGATLTASELMSFTARDWLLGRRLEEPERGRAAGVTANGELLVESGGTVRAIRAGTVVVAPQP
jgi:BirA family biotin operon repressor/biotin-[acetyl-CoA-carboxylase] ligase